MVRRHVYLIPGFFGFSSLGGLNYFCRVAETLCEELEALGIEADIYDCTTKPTASIRRRADGVIDEILESGGEDADEIHLVGHSTGGLDARLLSTPGVRLRSDDAERRIAERTVSCITVSTPHYGTPLAGFFNTLAGRHILEILTVLATSTPGRYGLFAGSQVLSLVSRIDDLFGFHDTFLDVWSQRLIGRLSTAADDPIFEFLTDVAKDQGAIIQLTPESMNLFNAAVIDHDHIHYASVVTAAPPPSWRLRFPNLSSPAKLASSAAFQLLYALASRENPQYPYPHPGEAPLEPMAASLPFPIETSSNDGVVPVLSQIYGEVLGVAIADHLDVVGQFDTGEPHSDWLPCGAGFAEADFRATWGLIAKAIADSSSAQASV